MSVLPPRSKIFRWAKLNLEALLLLAEKLRGRSCTCDESKVPKNGSLNWVIFITFDDGVQWVFRSLRYDAHMFSDETASKILLSEANREKIMNQLGAIMSRLSKVHFDKIGSLFEDDTGGFSVERGPFTGETVYLRSLISAFTSHAEELPLTPYLFFSPLPKPADYSTWDSFRAATDRRGDFIVVGDKLEGSKNRLDYCIAGQILEEMIPQLSSDSTGLTISHPDLHTGNLFVDEDLNITSIIDWGSATTGPVTELLATPGLAGPSKPSSVALTAAFQAGFSEESLSINRDMWGRAEMMWHLSRLVRLLSGQDRPLFQRLYDLVYKPGVEYPSDSRDYGWLFHQRALASSNKQLLSKLKEYDLTDDEVKEREKDVFSGDKLDRLPVAGKLTVMSEMNPGFIGGRRL
ncbi:hypothetical protein LZL87_008524 [Fusarium oxysporum]|nr:hypothetical protein LZL87_008524 [Fusarium oxysporum]